MVKPLLISKTAVLAAIDKAYADYQAALVEYDDLFEKYKAKHKADWHADVGWRWTMLRDRITAANKAKAPVTKAIWTEAFGETKYSQLSNAPVYTEPRHGQNFAWEEKDYRYPKLAQEAAMKSLRLALDSVVGDEVTYAFLQTLGYRNLSWLFNVATEADERD